MRRHPPGRPASILQSSNDCTTNYTVPNYNDTVMINRCLTLGAVVQRKRKNGSHGSRVILMALSLSLARILCFVFLCTCIRKALKRTLVSLRPSQLELLRWFPGRRGSLRTPLLSTSSAFHVVTCGFRPVSFTSNHSGWWRAQ